MIEIKATRDTDGYVNTECTMGGDSEHIGTELAAIIAEVLTRLEPAEGVSVKALAYAITDSALDALNNIKTRRHDNNGGS